MTAPARMKVFILNGMDVPLHVAAVRNAGSSMMFYVSPRRVPIPTGEIMKRDVIVPGEAFAATDMPKGTVPRVVRKGFTVAPKLTLAHARKDGSQVLVFAVRPWKPGEKTAAEAERAAKHRNG